MITTSGVAIGILRLRKGSRSRTLASLRMTANQLQVAVGQVAAVAVSIEPII
jgi:hypothetical protein